MNIEQKSVNHHYSIEELFEKFSKLKILVVGDVMLDAYLWGKVDRISPEAPVPVVAVDRKEERLGGAANVALNIKELGATPILCSVVGKDDAGKSLSKLSKKNRMRSDGILISSKRITTIKTRVLSKSHQLVRYDSEMTDDLAKDDEKKLLGLILSFIKKEKPQAVIFEDYNKGILTEALITSVIELCRKKNIFTAVDPKKKNFFHYQHADLFKPNLREVQEALHLTIDPSKFDDLHLAHHHLMLKLHHRMTMITLSDHGIYFQEGTITGVVPAHKRDISDVSGAGDTVIAVATLAMAAALPFDEAVKLANLAGGLVCEYSGVVPVTKAMLKQEYSSTKS